MLMAVLKETLQWRFDEWQNHLNKYASYQKKTAGRKILTGICKR